jgi:hypothetical protein
MKTPVRKRIQERCAILLSSARGPLWMKRFQNEVRRCGGGEGFRKIAQKFLNVHNYYTSHAFSSLPSLGDDTSHR